MNKIFGMLILSLFLAGCVSGHNSGTSDGIEIYIPSSSSIEKSQSKASAHCIKYGKKAVFVSTRASIPFLPSKFPRFDEYKCE